MSGIDVQLVTLAEAMALLVTNVAGGLLALLAWHVSELDVREARRWAPPTTDPVERMRLRHNRGVVTDDARYGERGRFVAHIVVGVIGVFWLLTPQPLNPAVVWWAVAIRGVAVGLSFVLIDKSLHHLVARWRFDHPERGGGLTSCWPALVAAWRELRTEAGP